MTTIVLPLPPSATASSTSPKAQEAVQLLHELGFGHETLALIKTQPGKGLRILLAECDRCWG